MATEKLYTVAGCSRLNGPLKMRFANDIMRIKVLAKKGHTDVELFELPRAMTKREIIQHLRSVGWGDESPELQEAMDQVLYRNPESAEAPLLHA